MPLGLDLMECVLSYAHRAHSATCTMSIYTQARMNVPNSNCAAARLALSERQLLYTLQLIHDLLEAPTNSGARRIFKGLRRASWVL